MKKRIFTLMVVALALVPSFAQAATLDQTRLDAISQRCTVIQTILNQLQRRDLVARTNRGRAYEAQIKQIDALDKRLEHNNIAVITLQDSAVNFKAVVETFRLAYVAYDDNMTLIRQMDCHDKASDFALKLEEIRVLRQAVGVEVAKGEGALSRYRQAVIDLRSTLPEAKKGND